jgi:uncharacterized protein (TIGR02996 family)
MNERDAFIRGIAANLYDDAPRLAFADWLDEHGEHDRAEFIRVQCELEPIRDKYEIPRAAELHAREEHFGSRGMSQYNQAHGWLGAMPEGWDDWRKGAALEYRRGFLDVLALPTRTFLELGARIRALHPTIRRVVLFRVNSYGERLAACAALEGLVELELACWYSEEDARAITASPYLSRLQVLELWLANHQPRHDARLCRIMAKGTGWPNLRALVLLNPDNLERASRKKLVATVNSAAGHEVAVYRPGYPDLFPFAPDFWYRLPGYLPDGRAAMADVDHGTNPPALCVVTFDKSGKQQKQVIRVPIPDEINRAQDGGTQSDRNKKLQQVLANALGFVPGFIRVRDVHFPGDQGGSSPCWHGDVWEELCGHPDEDTEESWSDRETGFGGACWHHLHNHEWIFGWDRWADKRGRVHST